MNLQEDNFWLIVIEKKKDDQRGEEMFKSGRRNEPPVMRGIQQYAGREQVLTCMFLRT